MPQKLSLIPTARTVATRPSNKNAHPGLVDLDPPQHKRATKTQETHQIDPSVQAMEEERQTKALQMVAQIEDKLQHEDDVFDARLHDLVSDSEKSE
jgi:hypothetical protein